jgi:hypothetical protein
MDENLPAKAPACVRRGLGEKGRKQHGPNSDSHQDGKRGIEKCHRVVAHDVVDA